MSDDLELLNRLLIAEVRRLQAVIAAMNQGAVKPAPAVRNYGEELQD